MGWRQWILAGATAGAALAAACGGDNGNGGAARNTAPTVVADVDAALRELRASLASGDIDSQRKADVLRRCVQVADALTARGDQQAAEMTSFCRSVEATDPNTPAAWEGIRQRVNQLGATFAAADAGGATTTPTATTPPVATSQATTGSPTTTAGATGATGATGGTPTAGGGPNPPPVSTPSALPPTGQNQPESLRDPAAAPRQESVSVANDGTEPSQLRLEANVATTLRVENKSDRACTFFLGDLVTKLQVPAGETRTISFQATVGNPTTAAQANARVVEMGCEEDDDRRGDAVVEFRGVLPGTGNR